MESVLHYLHPKCSMPGRVESTLPGDVLPAARLLDPLGGGGQVLGREATLGRGTRERADLSDGERLGPRETRTLGGLADQREGDHVLLGHTLLAVRLALTSLAGQERLDHGGVQTTAHATVAVRADQARDVGSLGNREFASRVGRANLLRRNRRECLGQGTTFRLLGKVPFACDTSMTESGGRVNRFEAESSGSFYPPVMNDHAPTSMTKQMGAMKKSRNMTMIRAAKNRSIPASTLAIRHNLYCNTAENGRMLTHVLHQTNATGITNLCHSITLAIL